MRPTALAHLTVSVLLLSLVAAVMLVGAPSAAQAWSPYWFSWSSSNCTGAGNAVDPVSTYFKGTAGKGGRVRHSIITHMGRRDPRWYEHTSENMAQYFKHYVTGACVATQLSIANDDKDHERMHIRGAQDASSPVFETGLTPHYEMYDGPRCGGHVIAKPGVINRDGHKVRGGGYNYARIKLAQAYGFGHRHNAWKFHFYNRGDTGSRWDCKWYVPNPHTSLQIDDGTGLSP